MHQSSDAGSKLAPHSAVPQSRSRWMSWTKSAKSAGASWCAVAPKNNRQRQTHRIAPNAITGLASPAKPRYIRINPSQVIGRRINLADIPPDWWGQ
jgi:hypothetical protein